MLFIGATLVPLPSILREHLTALPKRKESMIAAQHQGQKTQRLKVKLMMIAAISLLKIARLRARNQGPQAFSEGDFPFSSVNLQHKDSKKVLFPYEMGFFSSSIRIAIGE